MQHQRGVKCNIQLLATGCCTHTCTFYIHMYILFVRTRINTRTYVLKRYIIQYPCAWARTLNWDCSGGCLIKSYCHAACMDLSHIWINWIMSLAHTVIDHPDKGELVSRPPIHVSSLWAVMALPDSPAGDYLEDSEMQSFMNKSCLTWMNRVAYE